MDDSTADAPARRLRYAPGLDGLRAVACLAVMLYHAGFLHITGGFLGVSVFLTLSGFLITSLLLEELRGDNRIDLRGFWRRRVFRILPLLLVVSATWAVWGAMTDSPLGRATIVGAVTTVGLFTNWITASQEMAAGVLNGNWSVTLEEQFYVLWPLALLLLYRRFRSERVVTAIVVVVAAAVAVHRWTAAADWSRVWYSTDTQADALLVGCAVALGLRCRSRQVSIAAGAVLVGFLFLARPGEVSSAQLVMPAAVVCTALLIPFLQDHRTVLGWSPITAVGRRSYGLYLWGGPIVYLAKHVFLLDTVGVVGSIVLTFAVTELSYRMVELPMRRRGRGSAAPELTRESSVAPAPLAA